MEICSRNSSMTDPIEICMNKDNIMNPAEISSRRDRMADSAEISGKDDRMTMSHARRTKLVRGCAPETWDWLAVISDLVETFGNYQVVQQLSNRVMTVRWRRYGWLFVTAGLD